MTTQPVQPELTPLLEARPRTDYEIPIKWVWAPVASYIIWATIPIITYLYREPLGTQLAIPLGVLGLAGFVLSAASSYLVYHLVNRRNSHLARAETLLWTTLDTARARAQQTDMKTQVALGSAEHNLSWLTELGKEHSAILWAVLTLIPYLGWLAMTYVLAFLTHDLSKHEQREDLVIEDLGRVVQSVPLRTKRVPRRPIILYILASLATLGVFLPFWLYQAVRDPQAHFEYHRSAEPTLAPESAVSRSMEGVN